MAVTGMSARVKGTTQTINNVVKLFSMEPMFFFSNIYFFSRRDKLKSVAIHLINLQQKPPANALL